MSNASLSAMRIAYLTSHYPAASHTFIQREIMALETLGFTILPCAIREPAASGLIGPEEEAAYQQTFYVLKAARRVSTLPLAVFAALRRPKALVSMLGLALRTSPPGLKGALKQVFYVAEALVLSRHLQGQGATHIHNHFADQGANVAMFTSVLSDIPFSYTLHGPTELFETHKWYLGEKTAQARFVACISHFARSQVMYFSDAAHWDKLRIVHCGVVPERYARPRPSSDGLRLLFVGRLDPVKGVRVLLEAFAQARTSVPDLTLDIIGDGPDRAHLATLARPFGDAVTFHGYKSQEEVAAAMSAADVFVLPSFAEGLPVVLMEALAAGTPVICSQVAGVAELVEDGQSGFIVPAGDVDTLTVRILEIIANPERRVKMGARGQAKVREAFDIRLEAARLGRLFLDGPGETVRPASLEDISPDRDAT